jgi:hypothetical protein
MTANEHPLLSGNLYALLTVEARAALITAEVAYIAIVREFGENSYEARGAYRLHRAVLNGVLTPDARRTSAYRARRHGANNRSYLAQRIWRRLFGKAA